MNINIDSLTGREKRPLTRFDVEERLRQAGSSEKLNLAGETIAYSNLSNLRLIGANLNGTNLTEANLDRAFLKGASLKGASLKGADLVIANLSEADLSGANLSGAFLSGANLKGANLVGANLVGANLVGADLSGAFLSRANLSGAFPSRANLSGANLVGADLSGADLSRAILSGAILKGANLREANLREAILREANLREANLREANLSRANPSRANLSGASLKGADLSGTDLKGADLSRADLSRANLKGASLRGADLSGADLSGTDLSRTDLREANLSEAILREAKFIEDYLIKDANIAQVILNQISRNQKEEQEQGANDLVPTLRIRIEEDTLTTYRLSEVLDSLTSLYVKTWLLQQRRFDDLLHYIEHKNRQFEEEAHLIIAELKYNSPVNIKINLDLSPKSFIEALRMLADTISLRKYRENMAAAENRSKDLSNQLKEEKVRQAQLETTKQTFQVIIEIENSPLNEEQKAQVKESILNNIFKLGQDPAIEASLTIPPLIFQPQPEIYPPTEKEQSSAQPVEKPTSLLSKEVN